MALQDALIKLKNITKWYGRGQDRTIVLKDVSLSVVKGEFLAIIGPSGSGKTTLAHTIGGLITPSEGEIIIKGQNLAKRNDKMLARYRNQKVGFVFQNFSLIPYYSALENVELPLLISGMTARKRRRQAEDLLKTVGLGDRLRTKAGKLSGGERQRVSIARALIAKPDIIIADEPTGSLDSVRGREIIAILKKLNKNQGVTVLMVTHDQELAKEADRTIHILDGQVTRVVS